MDRCNELCTKAVAGACQLCEALAERDRFLWFWLGGGLVVVGIQAIRQWQGFVCLRQHYLLALVTGVLLLALCLPIVLPEWDRHVPTILRQHLLFLGAVGVGLLYLLLWKIPKWQVASVEDAKDRLTLESGFRQTLAQILGGAVLMGGLYCVFHGILPPIPQESCHPIHRKVATPHRSGATRSCLWVT